MDFEAELAAFSAEVETLAERVQTDDKANGAATPQAAAAAAAATSSAPAASRPSTSTSAAAPATGQKRKLAGDAAEGGSAVKKASFVVGAAAAESVPVAPTAAAAGIYSDVVAADLAAMQRHSAQTAAAAASSQAAAAAASSASAAAGASSAAAAASSSGAVVGQYITGQVYNGYLASVHPVTGEPMWVVATPEQIAASAANEVIRAKEEAEAAAAAAAAAKKAAKKERQMLAKGLITATGGIASGLTAADASKEEKHHLRTAAGKVWDDPTLQDWPENDYRLFCGDLGNEVSEQLLTKMFERWPSFARAKVVRDKRTGKSKGFGFVSFLDASECVEALKECDGKYVGNRPIRLKRSDWTKREASADKSWTAKHNQFGTTTTRGNKKLHLY